MKNTLKTHRILSRLTQEQVSEGTGITQSRLSRLETRPDAQLVQSITLQEIELLRAYFDATDGTGQELTDMIADQVSRAVSNQTTNQTRG